MFPVTHLFDGSMWGLFTRHVGRLSPQVASSPNPRPYVRLPVQSDWVTPNVGSVPLALHFVPRENFLMAYDHKIPDEVPNGVFAQQIFTSKENRGRPRSARRKGREKEEAVQKIQACVRSTESHK